MPNRAVRGNRKLGDMPPARTELKVERSFTAGEMERIRRGLVPEEMEDKWFVFCEGDRVYFHRSWTGICSYIVDFRPQGEDYVISRVQSNRNREQYAETDDEYDARLLLYLIDILLLGRRSEPPEHPADRTSEQRTVRLWAIAGRAAFGVGPDPANDPKPE